MSQIRLYIDEDAMALDLTIALRARGIDVCTALEAAMIRRSDEHHLELAAKEQRVLYTFNLADFYRLHTKWVAAGLVHAGLILAHQQRYSVSDQLKRLLRLAGNLSAEEMRGKVEFLSAWG